MADFVLRSNPATEARSVNSPDYPSDTWLRVERSQLDAIAPADRIIASGVLREMTGDEKAARDAAIAAAAAAVVPASITQWQARQALILSSVSIAAVDALIEAIEVQADREAAHNAWHYAQHIERTHPLVAAMGTALGLTSGQVDDLFRLAATLS